MAKHHPDLIFCRKQAGVAIGRLCDKCDGRCVICDSYVRPSTLVRICDECNYGSFQACSKKFQNSNIFEKSCVIGFEIRKTDQCWYILNFDYSDIFRVDVWFAEAQGFLTLTTAASVQCLRKIVTAVPKSWTSDRPRPTYSMNAKNSASRKLSRIYPSPGWATWGADFFCSPRTVFLTLIVQTQLLNSFLISEKLLSLETIIAKTVNPEIP